MQAPDFAASLEHLSAMKRLAMVALTLLGSAGLVAAGASWATAPALGDFGLDLTAGKSQVRPGDDFYSYAVGGWLERFEIPADHSSFDSFDQLEDMSRSRVRGLIEAAAASHSEPGSPAQKIGDYYASFMDEAAMEAAGLDPARADLKRIDGARSRDALARLFGTVGFASLFALQIEPDLREPSRYAVLLGQGNLGLPDRDYYLKDDPHLKEARGKYAAYIERMLTLAAVPRAHAKAQAIMSFETEAARVQWPLEKRRDVEATYNPRSKTELAAYAPGFPWQPFLDAAQIGGRDRLVVGELTAVRDLAALFARTDVATLRAYLTFHYLSDRSTNLPRRFDEARFAFYGTDLSGQPRQRERWKRGVDHVSGALGELVGQLYVAQYFPPQSKAQMQELVGNLLRALDDRIDHLEWMSPQTRSRAHGKIATFTVKIGYPDRWKDYSALQVKRGDPLGNSLRALAWQWDYRRARLDNPVDRSEWQLNPQDVNAYYNPLNNEIVFPAAILQPPFFDPAADLAVNYGAIGAVIGHEISHGFDDQGRKFGPDGSLNDWWTERDAAEFTVRAQRLVKQFSGFEALPGLQVNGASTLGENIGDLGGLNMAYHAYHLSLHGQPAPVMGGLTGDQRFFLSWAQSWRAKYRDGALRQLVLSDVHSPSNFRVNGPLPNIDAWYAAFDVKPGDKLYIRPEERVSIW